MRAGSAAALSAARCVLHVTCAVILLGVGLTACATRSALAPQLEVLYGREEALHYSKSLAPGETFELYYIHSVSKSLVYGGFQVTQNGSIQPLYTVYRAYGPGLPWAADEHTRTQDGALRISHEDELPRDELRMWVSSLNAARLVVGDEVLELSTGTDQARLVVIRLSH